MGIWSRLEDLVKSYINDESAKSFGKGHRGSATSSGDPDLDAAFEELDDFLSKDRGRGPDRQNRGTGPGAAETPNRNQVPESLRQDFAELGLEPGASAEECKAAYKGLLKLHHPDRHAGHPGNMKKATEKSARLNAAYDRIEKWRRGEGA